MNRGKTAIQKKKRRLDASISQGMPKIAHKPSEARKRQGRILFQQASEEAWPSQQLISDF